MYRHLDAILKDINRRNKYPQHLPYKDELINLLQKLPLFEQKYISNYQIAKFQLEWDCGSANIFSILQEANILNFADFLNTLDDTNENTQLIMNDILESNYTLLSNLIKHIGYNNPISIKITNILSISFRRLIEDIHLNNDCIKVNHLRELKPFLCENSLESIRQLHFQIFSEMYSNNNVSITDAFRQQKQWNTTFPSNTIVESILKEILTNQSIHLQKLFDLAIASNYHSWEFYLMCLRFIVMTKKSSELVKVFLQQTLQQFFEKQCDTLLYIVLITARQICEFNCKHFGNYSQWYKRTFSDIRERIKTNDFKYLIATLKRTIKYETDIEIMNVHVNTAISPAPLCNDIVLVYKQMCRSMLTSLHDKELKSKNYNDESSNVFVIDDDDDDDFE